MLLSQQLIAASEEASGTDLILPATSELIGGLIAFTIVGLIVWRFALPQIQKALDERQAAIVGKMQDAEQTKQAAEKLKSDYEAQIAGAKSEAAQIVEQARHQAETMKADIVARAQDEAAAIADRAKADIEAQRASVISGMRSEVASLSVDMAQKVVAGTVDRGAQQALVEQYLSELGGVNN
ncbi:MAG: F0F1 ATP synthase subunit B [Acidimicrobiia bacterium]|nr:F0F1 ATP synthase subunit B [Acidimicrobiia bacterium]MBT8250872.1 F0F1 ATP synthase subunit B [Acidimicrobiia bacterium]NND12497.1 F0F1 ATP synthase subunit B [Acidimicrobiia bacterium]NNL29035.1 F0F1 ATP synthase subunit B [Acidimicrobiia bacterium]